MYHLRVLFRQTFLNEEVRDTCPNCKKELTSSDNVLRILEEDIYGDDLKEVIEGKSLVPHLDLDEALSTFKEGTFCSTECLKAQKERFNKRDIVRLEVFVEL